MSAPTKIAWSIDNRTAGYRLVGDGTNGVRIECRIPGSDINPYLACAAQLAAGLSGIEEGLTLDAPVTQFGSGSVELIEKIVEGAIEKALAKRSTAQPDIEFPAAAAPHSSTVTETVVPQSTLKPEDSEAQAQPKVTGAKKKQQRWYYLGSADDACFN